MIDLFRVKDENDLFKSQYQYLIFYLKTKSLNNTCPCLTDENGGQSKVTIADVWQSNGVIHSVDTVVLPKM